MDDGGKDWRRRIKIWCFLWRRNPDWARIIVVIVLFGLWFFFYHRPSTELKKVEEAEELMHLIKNGTFDLQRNRPHKNQLDMLPDPKGEKPHHEAPAAEHHIPKGFYKSFDVIGGNKEMTRAKLVELAEASHNQSGAGGGRVEMTPVEIKKGRMYMRETGMNALASHMVSLHRVIDDRRPNVCQETKYDVVGLPTASVIITFNNEVVSVLFRTIWSILHNTPWEILLEIVVIDDASDKLNREKLKEKIQIDFPTSVKYKHLPERMGLSRARQIGAKLATGEVLVFLDSNVECVQGWLEPMLQTIKGNRTMIVSPVTNEIDEMTMEFNFMDHVPLGTFNWRLKFYWHGVPFKTLKNFEPIKTTLASGGHIAIDRHHFSEIGGFDEGLEIVGFETMELALRNWMCTSGGTVTHPCSHVGHIFKSFYPFSFGDRSKEEVLTQNARRMLRIWAGKHIKFFYLFSENLRGKYEGDITRMIELTNKLHCRSFNWFLQTVHSMMPIPNNNVTSARFGKLRNAELNSCVVIAQRDNQEHTYDALEHTCVTGFEDGYEYFSLTHRGEVRNDDLCLSVASKTKTGPAPVIVEICRPNIGRTIWGYSGEGLLVHGGTQLCLDFRVGPKKGNGNALYVATCQKDSVYQHVEVFHENPLWEMQDHSMQL